MEFTNNEEEQGFHVPAVYESLGKKEEDKEEKNQVRKK